MRIYDAVTDVQQALAKLNPLTAVEDVIDDVLDTLGSYFDFSASQFHGGDGNDVLAAGDAGGDLVGGRGDDAYLFTFGTAGDVVVDDAGLGAARNWGETLGVGDGLIDEINGGGGGTGVLELRGLGGFMTLTPDNLGFRVVNDSDLWIGMQTEGGTQLGSFGTVKIKDMNVEDHRIEVLRLVNADGFVEYDLARAFDDGVFEAMPWSEDVMQGVFQIAQGDLPPAWTDDASADLDAYFLGLGARSGVQTAFDDALHDWADGLQTAAAAAPVLEDAIASLRGTLDTAAGLVAPEAPDVFAYT